MNEPFQNMTDNAKSCNVVPFGYSTRRLNLAIPSIKRRVSFSTMRWNVKANSGCYGPLTCFFFFFLGENQPYIYYLVRTGPPLLQRAAHWKDEMLKTIFFFFFIFEMLLCLHKQPASPAEHFAWQWFSAATVFLATAPFYTWVSLAKWPHNTKTPMALRSRSDQGRSGQLSTKSMLRYAPFISL
jgi:hypothetical protein